MSLHKSISLLTLEKPQDAKYEKQWASASARERESARASPNCTIRPNHRSNIKVREWGMESKKLTIFTIQITERGFNTSQKEKS